MTHKHHHAQLVEYWGPNPRPHACLLKGSLLPLPATMKSLQLRSLRNELKALVLVPRDWRWDLPPLLACLFTFWEEWMINYALVLPFPAKAVLKSQFHHLQLLQHLSSSRRKLGKEPISWLRSSFERKHGDVPTASLARCRTCFQQNLTTAAEGTKEIKQCHSCLKDNRNSGLLRHGMRPRTKMPNFMLMVL